VAQNRPSLLLFLSGASRARTGDLLLAKQVLSQLSYGPLVNDSTGFGRCARAARQRSHPVVQMASQIGPAASGFSCSARRSITASTQARLARTSPPAQLSNRVGSPTLSKRRQGRPPGDVRDMFMIAHVRYGAAHPAEAAKAPHHYGHPSQDLNMNKVIPHRAGKHLAAGARRNPDTQTCL
jgi:hypothetical protein